MKICVIGLGYMGLPFSLLLAKAGFEVVGYDVSEERINQVNRGECPFDETGLAKLMTEASSSLRAVSEIEKADAFVISVPTPLDKAAKKADLSFVISAAESIAKVLEKENLVILESTVPPNTCRNVIIPILDKTGLKSGQDYYVAHCPERAIPGKTLHELVHNDRIIGGNTKKAAEMAHIIYSKFVKGDIFLTDDTTAEAVKLMENTYRDVNIALANELAKISEDLRIDVWESIELANRHPRVNIHMPGPGVGGHCIAIDPWFLIQNTDKAKIIKIAREINGSMPEYVVDIVKRALKGIEKPIIAVLGVAYKADVDDARESPSLEIIELLRKEGFEIRVSDPFVKIEGLMGLNEALEGSDCALILTDHSKYKDLDEKSFENMRNKIIIDTRNCLKKEIPGFRKIVLGLWLK